MPRFLVKSFIDRSTGVIEGHDYRHLTRVRRIKAGEWLDLRDGTGRSMKGRVRDIADDKILVEIALESGYDVYKESAVEVVLCVSVLKGKKFDLVIQKAVEVGVSRILPVISERAIPVLDDKTDKKTERWNRIAEEASKQSMRRFAPVIEEPVAFDELVSSLQEGARIIAHPDRSCRSFRDFLTQTGRPERAAVLVGPEGGFSKKEIENAVKHGWVPLNFGFTALRSETAAVVLPAIIIYEWGDEDEDHGERERDCI